jgi:hypothetical protein
MVEVNIPETSWNFWKATQRNIPEEKYIFCFEVYEDKLFSWWWKWTLLKRREISGRPRSATSQKRNTYSASKYLKINYCLDGGSKHSWNVVKFLEDHAEQHPRKQFTCSASKYLKINCYRDDGGSRQFCNIRLFIPDHTARSLRKQTFSKIIYFVCTP